ncbi:glucan endo-1,3-beta-D-glucosidase-like [Primulina huaijiensis]|uniref:glucan endo-1,3-beta-D-glucosidase-like n=1 Tax=Primulina huaijiensis TaxID=1492673 RepID=UPI003CC71B0F
MANSVIFLPLLGSSLIILLFVSGGILKPAMGASEQGTWCIPRPSTSEQTLVDNINFVCTVVDCSLIQEGGACFYPSNLLNHASVAMNLYYQKQGRHSWNCDFRKSGVIVVTDPSYGKCKFEFSY